MIQKETPSLILGPSRKSRTKIRKPKFLSLRLALSPESTQHSGEIPADHHHQLNLFPLHPENLVEDHKDTRDDDVAYFFSAADGGATTLTGLLGDGTASSSAFDVDSCNNVTNSTTTTLSTPESLTYAYGGQDMEEGDQQLVRTAMRNKERDPTSEEKWVCYSEVTDSSGGVSVSDLRWKSDEEKMIQLRQKRLSLKLDYEEIMNVWCDNIHLEYSSSSSQPQVVPDFHDDDLFGRPTTSNGWGTNGGLWKVPEMSGSNSKGCVKMEEVRGEECKMAQREASVSRYKEKRQNRLFSKKIRYQVRKLNAEKRPRIKGRFVRGKKLSE